jgi:hypothetical protein
LLWLFWRWVLTNCPNWPQTAILLNSASQVTRIIGISNWCAQLQSVLLLR